MWSYAGIGQVVREGDDTVGWVSERTALRLVASYRVGRIVRWPDDGVARPAEVNYPEARPGRDKLRTARKHQ